MGLLSSSQGPFKTKNLEAERSNAGQWKFPHSACLGQCLCLSLLGRVGPVPEGWRFMSSAWEADIDLPSQQEQVGVSNDKQN